MNQEMENWDNCVLDNIPILRTTAIQSTQTHHMRIRDDKMFVNQLYGFRYSSEWSFDDMMKHWIRAVGAWNLEDPIVCYLNLCGVIKVGGNQTILFGVFARENLSPNVNDSLPPLAERE